MDEIKDRESLEVWLKDKPHEVAIAITARAAMRVAPLLVRALRADAKRGRETTVLRGFRALASARLPGAWLPPTETDAADLDLATMAAVTAGLGAVHVANKNAAAFRDAAIIVEHAAGAASRAVRRAMTPRAIRRAISRDPELIEANLLAGNPPSDLTRLAQPLWHDALPDWAAKSWQSLKLDLLNAGEGWEVWTDWYDAILQGRPLDPAIEVARARIPERIWEQGPAAVNAEIARLIAEHHAARPQGETLEYEPASNQVGLSPAPVEDRDALINAVAQVEDALADFRRSPVGNRAYALNPVLVRLDRMLERYRNNPRRVHDELVRASRDIARAIEADQDIDAIPTRDLRYVCGQGAIDVRIAVPAVSEMEADRRRRTARQPSRNAQSAAQRLLAEIGEGLTPDLRDEMIEDVETVAISGLEDGDELPDSAARSARVLDGFISSGECPPTGSLRSLSEPAKPWTTLNISSHSSQARRVGGA